jgi:hypothetical protein
MPSPGTRVIVAFMVAPGFVIGMLTEYTTVALGLQHFSIDGRCVKHLGVLVNAAKGWIQIGKSDILGGRVEGWKGGKMEDWKVGRSESWKADRK